MSFWAFLYIFLNISCVAALIYLIIILSPYKHVPASKAFFLFAGTLILWLVVITNQVMFVFSASQVMFLHRLTESIFLFIPLAFVLLVDKFATVTQIMKKWVYVLFGIIMLIILGLIWTNDTHHLYWQVERVTNEGNLLHLIAQKTIAAKVLMTVQHLEIVFASFHFLNLILTLNNAYRRTIDKASISFALTSLFSALTLIHTTDAEFTLLPAAMTASCVSLAFFITEHHIFDLVPISRASYFNHLADGAIVVSRQGDIIDISNLLQEKLGESETKKLIGKDILTISPDWKHSFQRTLDTTEDQTTQLTVTENGVQTQYDITLHPNQDHYGYIATVLIKFQDVTFYHQLIEQVNELAIRDPLTGILNRRHFELLVLDHLKLAQRYQRTGCLLMFDLDDFKHVNDFYGHQIGDQVLTKFSNEMNQSMRDSDIFARYGGDEFVLYFPETTCDGALIALNDLKKFILGTTIDIEDIIVPLKCTTGMIPITQETLHLSYDELIKCADKAMYAAKLQGPNVVGIYNQEEISFHIISNYLD